MRATARFLLLHLLCSRVSPKDLAAASIPPDVVEACLARGLAMEYSDQLSKHGRVLQIVKVHAETKELPFFIDMCDERLRRRCRQASSELVVRAVRSGLQRNSLVHDFTAGLGRDALLLAAAGMQVVMFERNNILYHLLKDALERLRDADSPLHSRLTLIYGDASSNLSLGGIPEVVYLDPMYPANEVGRKSNVKKETQILHRILEDEGSDDVNNRLLFDRALESAQQKVVVKRPIHSDPILRIPPQTAIRGKNHRTHAIFHLHRIDSSL